MQDTIADLLTRIRNAQARKLLSVDNVPNSKMNRGILDVLVKEGYVDSYLPIESDATFSKLRIMLKYSTTGEPVISIIKRVSRPGRRVYSTIKDLRNYYNGFGISILSTSHGIKSDKDARLSNVGGEVIATVF